MGVLVLIGLIFQGVFGVAAAIFLSAIIGIVYGIAKKDRQIRNGSVIAWILDVICMVLFWFCLTNSHM